MSDPYDLNLVEHRTPALPGEVRVFDHDHQALDALALALLAAATGALERGPSFSLALGFGPALDRLCTLLCIDPRFRAIPWEQASVWVHDADPADPIVAEVREGLIDHVPVEPQRFHVVAPGSPAGRAALTEDAALTPVPDRHDAWLIDAVAARPDGRPLPTRAAFLLAIGPDARPAVRAAEQGLGPLPTLARADPRWYLDAAAVAE
ncbi:MAG: hypothetical protein AAF078_02150 [Planctomycetota bacterium]